MYEEDPVRHHAYYQWVPFVLFSQAIMFYLPHLFWRSWEGGKLKILVDGMHMIKLSKYVSNVDTLNVKVMTRSAIDGRVSFYQLFETW
jgi:innexin